MMISSEQLGRSKEMWPDGRGLDLQVAVYMDPCASHVLRCELIRRKAVGGRVVEEVGREIQGVGMIKIEMMEIEILQLLFYSV